MMRVKGFVTWLNELMGRVETLEKGQVPPEIGSLTARVVEVEQKATNMEATTLILAGKVEELETNVAFLGIETTTEESGSDGDPEE